MTTGRVDPGRRPGIHLGQLPASRPSPPQVSPDASAVTEQIPTTAPFPAASGGEEAQPSGRRPRLLEQLWARRISLAILVGLLIVVAVVHATGMARAPQRVDDEGTYVAQAWAVRHWGTLGHYTYWYDHPPLGWLLLAA